MSPPRDEPSPKLLELVIGLALRCYPASFRDRYGREFRDALRHRWRREGGGGWASMRRTVALVARDVASSLPTEWRRELRRARGGGARGTRARPSWVGLASLELRGSLRALRRRPLVSALLVLTLALGVGANIAVFSVLDRALLRPLPFPDADRMAYLMLRHRQRGFQRPPGGQEVAAVSEGAGVLDRIEWFRNGEVTWTGIGLPERHSVLDVSPGLVELLRVPPVEGRTFSTASIASIHPEVMLNEDAWIGRFGRDLGVLGSTVVLDGLAHVVVGVWPRGAVLDGGGRNRPVFVRAVDVAGGVQEDAGMVPLALLREGVSRTAAGRRLEAVAAARDGSSSWAWVAVSPTTFLGDQVGRGIWAAFLAAGVLLVIAVVNVVGVQVGRAFWRSHELEVRNWLGASGYGRLYVFVADGVLIAAASALLAALLMPVVLASLEAVGPTGLGMVRPYEIDARLILYGSITCGAVGLLTALAPAAILHLWRARTRPGLRLTQTHPMRVHGFLVTAQVALTMLLLAGAGLAARSMERLASVDPGFALDRIVTVELELSASRYGSPEARAAFNRELTTSLLSLPGVDGLTTSGNSPLTHSIRFSEPFLERTGPGPETGLFTSIEGVAPGYFGVLGIPLIAGRAFTADDLEAGAPLVVIVNQAFDSSQGGGVLGERLRFPNDSTGAVIVGVVGDVRSAGLDDHRPDRVQLYYPMLAEDDRSYARYVLRTDTDPNAVLPSVRRRIADIDASLVPRQMLTGADLVYAATSSSRFMSFLFGLFGSLSALLALTGVYALASLGVSRRVREIGVRMALGATPGPVARWVAAQGLGPVVVGVVIGAVVTALATSYLDPVLYDLPAVDVVALGGAAVVMVAVGAIATYGPAHRAAVVDPTESLRDA